MRMNEDGDRSAACLRGPSPARFPQVARSDALMRALDGLAAEGRLARVVVDEAHCVSVRALAL